MKICPVGAELFHADGRKDSNDEVNSLFRNFANASKNRTSDDGMTAVLARNVRKRRKFSLQRIAASSENTEGSEVVWKITLK
jgi:hypothetical protein